MKLYTRKGDDGLTELFGGQRLSKASARMKAIGAVDELNAALGLAAVSADSAMRERLESLQARLFELGADLASPPIEGQAEPAAIPRITNEHVTELERQIDRACESLPDMRHFILPGGTELAARLHLARAICRRAERHCVALCEQESDQVGRAIPIVLNRVSDLLFALARGANHQAGVADVPWRPRGSEQRP